MFTDTFKMINATMDGSEVLDELVFRLISLANKTISLGNPIADGMLPMAEG